MAGDDNLKFADFNNHKNFSKDPASVDTADLSSFEVSEVSNSLCLQKTLPELPHRVFDRRQKRWMVYIVSFASLFSPLSSNIYFPALRNIATVGTSFMKTSI